MKFKKASKIIAVMCMLLMAVTIFAGCGGEKKEKKDETLIAVTESTFPPFDTTDEKGNLVGFDMDLLDAIAKDQGFKVEYKSMEFDSLIPAIKSGNADIIAAGMTAEDPQRKKKVDFSDIYYDSAMVLMVKKDNETIKDMNSLTPEMVVASQIGTTSGDMAQKWKEEGKIKDVKINNGFTECVSELQNGDVDAVLIDEPVAKALVKKHADLKIVGEPLTSDGFGFAVAKGNKELLDKINKGLANIKKDGTYDKIYQKWFTDGAAGEQK